MPSPEAPVRLIHGDARRANGIPDESVHLVATSPPYPMIPQWDELFRRQRAARPAAMRRSLAAAWRQAYRVLVPGGLLVVVIGDALRTIDGEFRLWPNHAETLVDAARIGFRPLPYALWKKPTNKPNAFLGSGFLPPNAYVTLDCEFVLVFRKGRVRRFLPHDAAREQSRLSRVERDRWFSQVWEDVRGVRQGGSLGRTGAFPEEVADRIVRMFSVVGDTVLDPFAGTGTTVWAAARLGRHAIGVEYDRAVFDRMVATARDRGLLTVPGGPEAGGAVRRPAAPR